MTRKVGDERAIRLRNPDAYELHSVAMLQGITIRKPAFPSMLLITAETRYMKHIVTHFLSKVVAQRNE